MVGDRWEIGDREVAADTLSAAKEEAERVLRLEGIDLEWFTCARNKAEIPNYQGCAKLGVGPAALALSLLPRSMSRKLSGQRSAFGYAALVPQGQGYPIYASVFVDRAAELVDRFNALGDGCPSLPEILVSARRARMAGRSQLRVTVPYQPDRVGQRPPLRRVPAQPQSRAKRKA